ncbi:NEMP family [Sesbania bispinosa]|nr:NEMP family [Sesbania bispinosa]
MVMARAHTSQHAWILRLFFLLASAVLVLANERSLILIQNTTLQLSHGFPVGNSPGSKPGATVVVERVNIHGLSRFRNLGKYAHSVKVKVLPTHSNVRLPNVEVCFHRNASLAVGMCPQGQWEKVAKGSWARSMSPFDHKILDIRTAGSTLENFEVSTEEEFFVYRIVLLISGIILMSSADFISKSLAFYYGSSMAIGIILVILIILYQGMKLLPTGRKSSLAIFLYSITVGFGTFLLQYIPGLVCSLLTELGIDEDMYYPVSWLGFWMVPKLVLTEDGSVDISTAQFVAWAIKILSAIMILQSSLDPLLGTLALLCGSFGPWLKWVLRLRFLRRLRRRLFKSPKKNRRRSQVSYSSTFDDSLDDMYKMQSKEDSTLLRPQLKTFNLAPCKSSERDFTRTPPKTLAEEIYPSIIHTTPERRKYSAAEWDAFTKESTEKALEELVASPDFSKWLSTNADRISVTPNSRTDQRRRWWL